MIEEDDLVAGFTCTRDGWTLLQEKAVKYVLDLVRPSLVVHGGGRRGDEQFDTLCKKREIPRRIYPANNLPRSLLMSLAWNEEWDDDDEEGELEVMKGSPAPGRNLLIIEDSHLVIACPNSDRAPTVQRGQGTWHTVRHTREAGKPLFLIPPNGILLEERMKPVYEWIEKMRPRQHLDPSITGDKPRKRLRTDL
jgi:hypothetical protein